MATFTSKAGLRKPDASEPVIVGTDINDNYDKIDASLGAYICTSSTRPTGGNRFTGQVIYETDTTCRMMWDGTEWLCIAQLKWQSYTVVVTGSTTNPNFGSGSTRQGKYIRGPGKSVNVQMNLEIGTGPTAGSGTYQYSLPFTAAAITTGHWVGSCWCADASAGNDFEGTAVTTGLDNLRFLFNSATQTNVFPFTIANGDQISGSITYEMA